MLHVYICVGSVCHINGSYEIAKLYERLVRENQLSDQVELKASFCLGNCRNGVSVKVEDEFIGGVNSANAEEKFRQHILERVKNGYHSV